MLVYAASHPEIQDMNLNLCNLWNAENDDTAEIELSINNYVGKGQP